MNKVNGDKRQNVSRRLSELLMGRNNYFDLIRVVAAILVIFSHAYPLSGDGSGEPLSRFSNGQINFGNLAVFIFFVISGLLITQSYLHSNNLIVFLKSRLLRIFPGLMGVLLFSVFIIGPIVTELPLADYFTSGGIVEYLKAVFLFPMQWNLPGVFESNVYKGVVNGSLWTIPFEFICYLLVGLLGFLGILRYKYVVLLFSLILYYFYTFGDSLLANSGHLFGMEIKTLIELSVYFMAGSIVYLFKDVIIIKKEMAMLSLSLLLISFFNGGFKPVFVIAGTYLILYIAYLPKSRAHVLTQYGDFSYGLYLYAFPVQQMVTYFYGGSTYVWLNFLISVPITYILAVISWYVIEKRALLFKKRNFFGERLTLAMLQLNNHWNGWIAKVCGYFFRMNWIKFGAYLIVAATIFLTYQSQPTAIEFPYTKNQNILKGDWLPQSNSEKYRWVAKQAGIVLDLPTNGHLLIDGFVPDTFTEINSIKVYLNDEEIYNTALVIGEGFFLDIPISNGKGNSIILMEFNDVHSPDQASEDQRKMSALISKIEVK
ncbi:acyltransferase [Paenibacillus sp. FSL E2-0151]|uniref:acyltransferase family protein n=1 Tax=Paenibacillus sp. FSL E2-0151 TaxID=2921357 RepID=UPI0030ED007D